MQMQELTGELKRARCENCETSSSSMWENGEHKLMLVCFNETVS